MVNPRFYLFFLMLISNGTKEQDRLKINWCGQKLCLRPTKCNRGNEFDLQ